MNIQDTKQKMLDRELLAREQMQEQRDNHMLQEQMRAEAKTEELNELLKAVPKPMQMEWRFQVALLMSGRPDVMGDLKQLQYDERLLEMARYGITGQV